MGGLVWLPPLSFKKIFLMGTCMHTCIGSHVYTLVLTPLAEIEFVLGGFNFLSDGVPSKWAIVP